MAVPSTATFNPNRARIVQLALTKVGALGPGSVAPAQDAAPLIAHANDCLNALVKSMDADGIMTWRVQRRTLTTIAGQASYAIANDVYDIDQPGRYTISGQTAGNQVMPMSRDEYMVVGDRTLTGVPIQYLVEKTLDASGLQLCTLTFYPVPASSGDTFEYTAVVKARDQTTDADTLDVPQLWVRCLMYGLAADLAYDYGLPMDRIKSLSDAFAEEREKCLMQDGERGDTQLVPWGSFGYYGGYYGQGYHS